MAKIIVDIGLPKTGSTTRQFGLFSKLHENGTINYLGRNSTWHKANNVKEQQRLFLIYWQVGIDFNIDDLGLVNDKINVLSNEKFTRVPAYDIQDRIIQPSPLMLPELLCNKLLGHDVHILFFLRNQTSFLYSEYVNAYGSSEKFRNTQINTLQKFSFTNSTLNRELVDAGDFGSLMEKYVHFFGRDKVKCLFFEDLKNDTPKFYNKLAEIFNIDASSVSEIYQQNHYKKKTQKGSNYEVRGNVQTKKTIAILKALNKSFPRLMQLIKGILKPALPSINKTVTIDDFTPDQKNLIKRIFFESNMKLVDLGLVTKEGLEKNGYL